MNLGRVIERRKQVEAFLRQHRVGILTLVFTDMVGSTNLKQRLGDLGSAELIQEHHALVRQILAGFADAEEISTAGDSFFIVFAKPSDAARFALTLHHELRGMATPEGEVVADRVGIHVGEVMIEEEVGESKDLYGIQVDICARVMSLAEGGQTLLTRTAFDHARQVINRRDLEKLGTISWLNHGQYLLKGVDEAMEICEIGEAGMAPLRPPGDSEKARRHNLADLEPVLGWRPAVDQQVPGTGWVLQAKLGEGGFGEVWIGRNEALNEQRVFKFCFRADRARSLRRELTLFRLLKERIGDHPNIVPVREVYFETPPYYLILEYAGTDLKQWADARGGLPNIPLAERLEVVAQAADGLQAAHDAGVIHRDVKPSNILVRVREGKELAAKITDFGIGQVVSSEALAGFTRAGFTQTLISTGSGSQTGTYLYLAPELLTGQPATTRSDIYSLGVVLYQMVVGDWTRPATSDWSDHVEDPLLRADLKRCLAGRPEDRFAGAAQVAERLRGLAERRASLEREQLEIAQREREAFRRGVLRSWLAAGALCVAMAALMLVAFQKSRLAARQTEVAKGQAALAKEATQESQRRLARLTTEKGARLMEEGDLSGALLYFVEALKLDPGGDAERVNRDRIANILRHLPIISQRIGSDEPFRLAAFNASGAKAITLDNAQQFKEWDLEAREPVETPQASLPADAWQCLLTAGGEEFVAARGNGKTNWLEVAGLDGGRIAVSEAFQGYPRNISTSADGRHIGVMLGNSLFYWNVAEGTNLAPVFSDEGDYDFLHSLVSPDGRSLAVSPKNRPVRVLDLQTLAWVELAGSKHGEMSFDPQGGRLALFDSAGSGRIWSASTGEPLTPQMKNGAGVYQIAFSADGALLAVSCGDRTCRVWEAGSGTLFSRPIEFPRQAGRRLAFSHDKRRLAAACGDLVGVWDVGTGLLDSPYLRPNDEIVDLRFSDNDERLLVAGGAVTVWDLRRSQLHPLGARAGSLHGVAFSPDMSMALTCALINRATFWDGELLNPTGVSLDHGNRVRDVWFSADSQRAITVGTNFGVWDARTGQRLKTPPDTRAVSADGRRVAWYDSAASLARVLNTETGEQVGPGFPMADAPTAIELSPNGKHLAAKTDAEAFVWKVGGGATPLLATPLWQPLSELAFSPAGEWFYLRDPRRNAWSASGGGGDVLNGPLRSLSDGRVLLDSNGFQGFLRIDFSEDDRRLLVVEDIGRDQPLARAKVWETTLGKELAVVEGIPTSVGQNIQMDPRGDRFAVVCGRDGCTRIWDARSGAPISGAMANRSLDDNPLLLFGQDGATLVTASLEGTIRVWNSATGELLGPSIQVGHSIREARLSPDGRYLVTLFEYQTEIWKVGPEPERRSPAELLDLAQGLTGMEINAVSDLVRASGSKDRQAHYLELKRRRPQDFMVSAREVEAWRLTRGVAPKQEASGGVITSQPRSKVAQPNEDVEFEVEAAAGSTFQWRFQGVPLPGATARMLSLKQVGEKDLGSYSVVVSNRTGVAASKAALLSFHPIDPHVVGQWDFDGGNLAATIGHDLEFLDGPAGETSRLTRFGSPPLLGVPGLPDGEARVMETPQASPVMGFRLKHDATPNGNGEKVNQYTLVFDILWRNPDNQRFSAFAQIDDMSNRNDSDLFASWTNGFGGIGINESYEGEVGLRVNQWHRVVFAVDMAASMPVISKFIDGKKHADQTQARGVGLDDRFALNPTLLLFTDENGETTPGFVNSIQLRDVKMTDEAISALGGPTASGIPYLRPQPPSGAGAK